MAHIFQKLLCRLVWHAVFVWLVKAENNTDAILSSSMSDSVDKSYKTITTNDFQSIDMTPSSVEFQNAQTSIWPSYLSSELLSSTATDVLYFDSSYFSSNTLLLSSVPEYETILNSDSSQIANPIGDGSSKSYHSTSVYSVSSTNIPLIPTPTAMMENERDESSVYINLNSSDTPPLIKSKTTRAIIETSHYPHFHTPLMSLLVASSSLPFQPEESYETSVYYSSIAPTTFPTLDNESSTTELSTVPMDSDHKKLLMLVLRAEDCSKLSKADFEKMLGKLMAKFGFGDVVPQVSNAQCHSHLHINLTLGNTAPTLRFLPNMDGKNNVTVDVLNRTFRIVKVEKVDLKFEKTQSFNVSNAITKVAKHESITYIAIGVSFGLVLVICTLLCCVKCCCLQKSKKRYITGSKCTHMRLRPEDYTLTPIPRPNSLYVDYYRGSAAGDIYSTTSAGSIASTPTVQPFDTSIVPLEDTAAVALDISRDPSVESVPSDMKTFQIQGLAAKALRNAATDSKEHLNPGHGSRRPGTKASGVSNPSFQRF
ncbi:hypothetical protein JTE90_009850 [Oedothorax gibbosus]|uniref:Uncharacterized protein n=1 Tax=Oedothorax gibbosus TaxID=931172 RepID=A0AAV6TZ51_9ARAC|nr:hypothetical protein JTE90_009850 [Oedothorax gibbosus]